MRVVLVVRALITPMLHFLFAPVESLMSSMAPSALRSYMLIHGDIWLDRGGDGGWFDLPRLLISRTRLSLPSALNRRPTSTITARIANYPLLSAVIIYLLCPSECCSDNHKLHK